MFSSVLRTLVLVFAALAMLLVGAQAQTRISVGVADPNDLDLQLVRNLRCLIDTMYTEARGEGEYAQALVAHVVVARWKEQRPEWGKTVCEVAYRVDIRKGRLVSQFSGNIHHLAVFDLRDRAVQDMARVAFAVLIGMCPISPEHKCTRAYQRIEHAASHRQSWFATLRNIGNIGKHTWYCLPETRMASKK